ncbi:MAG: ABC transporter permease [Chloroflexota bacterium]
MSTAGSSTIGWRERRSRLLLGYSPGMLLRCLLRSRFARAVHNNPVAVLGLAIVFAFLVAAFFPWIFTSYNPVKLNLLDKFLPPSSQHWFGTDSVGMDVYARVIHGASITLQVVVVVLTIAVSIGYLLGSISGYFGGKVDEWVMRFTDVFLAFPNLVLAIAVNAALGRGLTQTMLAVAFSWWPSYARLIRGQVLSVKHDEHVTAARALGASTFRILFKHVLPNCSNPVIVRVTLDVGYVALATAGLSFLGLGAEPPTPEWGRMVAEGRDYLLDQWWWSTFPGLAIFLVVVGFNLLGEIVRDWLDPGSVGR